MRRARSAAGFDVIMPSPLGMIGLSRHHDGIGKVAFLGADTPPCKTRDSLLGEAVRRIDGYFYGADADFSDLPLAPQGTAFQHRVWTALRAIAPGQTRRYGELAADLASGARAVGGACRANPWVLLVPCHRIIAANGDGGFMGAAAGAWPRLKQHLLAHEQRYFAS